MLRIVKKEFMKKFKFKFPELFYHLHYVIAQNDHGSGLMEHNF